MLRTNNYFKNKTEQVPNIKKLETITPLRQRDLTQRFFYQRPVGRSVIDDDEDEDDDDDVYDVEAERTRVRMMIKVLRL